MTVETPPPAGFTIRHARPGDAGRVLAFVRELAAFERLAHAVQADEAALQGLLFGPRPYAEVIFAERDGEAVGFALFFHTVSTFVGKPGLFLEDLFVQPAARGHGYGKALMTYLARLAVERGCGRFEWSVLEWNAPSIAFYRSLGARPLDDWRGYRLDADALRRLAAGP